MMDTTLMYQEHPAVRDDLYECFIGEASDYYLPRFQKFSQENTGFTFRMNWWAFIFGLAWFLFRKMYAYAAGLVIIKIFVDFMVVDILGVDSLIYYLGSPILFALFMGGFGNYLYYTHANKKIARIMERERDFSNRCAMAKKAGGKSPLLALAMGILIIVCIVWLTGNVS